MTQTKHQFKQGRYSIETNNYVIANNSRTTMLDRLTSTVKNSRSFGRKRSQQQISMREKFFSDLSYRGNKFEKQLEYEARKREMEMQGCTFKPEVSPLPQVLP